MWALTWHLLVELVKRDAPRRGDVVKARLEDFEKFATVPGKIQKERVKPIEKSDEMQKRAFEDELKLWAARHLEDMLMGREAGRR